VKKINVIIEDDMYRQINKVKTKLQKEEPDSNISLTTAVKFVLSKGLK